MIRDDIERIVSAGMCGRDGTVSTADAAADVADAILGLPGVPQEWLEAVPAVAVCGDGESVD